MKVTGRPRGTVGADLGRAHGIAGPARDSVGRGVVGPQKVAGRARGTITADLGRGAQHRRLRGVRERHRRPGGTPGRARGVVCPEKGACGTVGHGWTAGRALGIVGPKKVTGCARGTRSGRASGTDV